MWCTRWYLPLVLLAFPTASPFFIWLFLFSTTMQARPCFYCIILLSSLFMSSCYWPPVPLETPLTVPWSENVTTYADALSSLLPNLPEDLKPADVPMLDRCWCDLTHTGVFDRFNVTRWEMNSVLRLKDELEQKMKAREDSAVHAAEYEHGRAEVDAASSTNSTSPSTQPHSSEDDEERSTMLADVWNMVWSFSRNPNRNSTTIPHTSSNASLDITSSLYDDDASNTSLPQDGSSPHQKLPLFRREYDLRPYGFALTVDFGWPTGALS